MSAQPNGTNNMENPSLIAGHAQYVKGAAEVCFPPLSSFPSLTLHALHILPTAH